jgi:predicted nucleic acid-binding protein
MPFVLDASVTITWAMQDETHPIADAASRRLLLDQGLVPPIWWCEVRNILLINERRQRISQADSTRFLHELDELPIKMDGVLDRPNLPDLARQFRLTVYDAAYLELAVRKSVPLATLDKALRTAAEAAGVPLLA